MRAKPKMNRTNPFAFNDDTDDESTYQHPNIDGGAQDEERSGANNPQTIPDIQLETFMPDDGLDHDASDEMVESHQWGNHSNTSLRLDHLSPPRNARISSSPKHQTISHMRDNSQSFIIDPFNSAFDDVDDDVDEGENRSIYSTNTYLHKSDNVNVYERSSEELYNTSTTNILTTPNRALEFPQSQISFDNTYSPSDSSQGLNYYENADNTNDNIDKNSNTMTFDPLLSSENYSHYSANTNNTGDTDGSPIFQNFERDADEPVLNNNELFENLNTGAENIIQNTNFADKGDNKVELIDGKYYSFDYPVPSQLLNKIPFEGAKQLTEFTHLRYHAITADPKDYGDDTNFEIKDYIENYPLRQNIYPIKRETELMIVCTMYNEDEVLLGRTLKGVFKNIKTMYNLNENPDIHPFGKNSWQKIVVVIISDGKNKINEKAKSLLTLLGVFQEGIMQEYVNDDKVNAHLFEYSTTFGIGKFDYNRTKHSFTVPLVTEQTIPIQLMFLLKEENKQKINSHRWAFDFLCPNLNPKVIALLDVGTEPGPDSIFKLWKSFKNPKVGGACGEIRAMLGNHASSNDESSVWTKMGRLIYFKLSDFLKCFMNPLVAAQNFEYKMSNILDKPMESAFGFVTVLPGAFSAYRYEALKGAPLKAYFHGENMKTDFKKPAGILESNMYLAEDRILCFELIAKAEQSYLLKYVHNSYAVTDVPSQINEFVNQRRRWLNGSFFAALYSVLHFYRILVSTHSIGRKIALIVEVFYQIVNILLSWFALSIYFLVFRILTLDVVDTFVGEKVGNILSIVFLWVYIGAIVLTFIISFGNKPNDAKYLYLLAFSLFASIVIYMTFCVISLTIESVKLIKEDIGSYQKFTASIGLKFLKNAKFRDLTVSLASTYALYIIGSLIFLDVFHLFSCTLQYILLSPAYINVLSIFAFCNMNDISWGTKGALTNEVKVPKKAVGKEFDVDDGADGADEEKKVLLLSENLENPDILYKKAQNSLDGKLSEGETKGKSDDVTDELKLLEENMKISEKNYALGRTYTVIIWLVSNFILLVIILRTGGLENYSDYVNNKTGSTSTTTSGTTVVKRSYWNDMNVANYFMTTILWIVAALALFRLCGCIYYRISFFIGERRYHRAVVI